MWSETEVREAARNWRAAHAAMVQQGDKTGAILADGYASALEMVLESKEEK